MTIRQYRKSFIPPLKKFLVKSRFAFLSNPAVLLVLVLLLAASVRLYNVTTEDLDLAEAFRVTESDTLNSAFYTTLNYEEHPPLYNIFLHFWMYGGSSVFWLRFSSVLFGLGSIFLIYLLGRHFFDQRTGLLAALLLAVNPLHLNYSQNVEPYIFTIFFSFLSMYYFVKALETDRFRHWFGFVVPLLIAGYSDHFIALLLSAIVLSIVFTYSTYKYRLKSLLLAAGALFILFIPNLFIVFFQFVFLSQSEGSLALRHPLWYILIIPYNFITFAVGERSIFFQASYFPVKGFMPILFVFAFFYGLLFIRGVWPFRQEKEKKILLLSWFVIPIIALYAISLFMFMFIDPHRFLFISFPFFILVAKGLSSIKRQWLFTVLLILLFVLGGIGVYSHYQQHKPIVSPITSLIANQYQPGDIITVMPQQYLPVIWYYLPKNIPATSFPTNFPLNIPVKFSRYDYNQELVDEKTIPLFISYQDKISQDYSRLWLVVETNRVYPVIDPSAFVFSYFSQHYPLEMEYHSSDRRVAVYLFELKQMGQTKTNINKNIKNN